MVAEGLIKKLSLGTWKNTALPSKVGKSKANLKEIWLRGSQSSVGECGGASARKTLCGSDVHKIGLFWRYEFVILKGTAC